MQPNVGDFDDLVTKMKSTVDQSNTDAGTVISAAGSSTYYTASADGATPEAETPETANPQYVENNIYVDGKKTARILTPYVAKELEWEEK